MSAPALSDCLALVAAALLRIDAGPSARRQAPDLPEPPSLFLTEHRTHAVAYMDETGLRVAGERVWLHVICDGRTTLYLLGPRGAVWMEYTDTAGHDRLASYWSRLLEEAPYGVCNVHLLRNLEEIVKLKQAPDGWAARMLLEARGTARDWLDRIGRPMLEGDRGLLRRAPRAGLGALRKPAPTGPLSPPRPQSGPVAVAGRLPALNGQPRSVLHQQSGRTGPAHGPANEDLERLPHAGRDRPLRPNAGADRDRPQAGTGPARAPADGPGCPGAPAPFRPSPTTTNRPPDNEPSGQRYLNSYATNA